MASLVQQVAESDDAKRRGSGNDDAARVSQPTLWADTPPTRAISTVRPSGKITLAQLEAFLFRAADILRGKMDASEFKEFIFGMLFLKRLSDEFDRKRDELRNKDFAHF